MLAVLALSALWLGPAPEPEPIADLKPVVYRHRGRVRSSGATIDVTSVTTVVDATDAWKITHKVTGRNFDFLQVTRVEKKTLRVLEHDLRRGPMVAKAQAFDDKVVCQSADKSFEVELDEPLFADGAGNMLAIASLPLKEDYRTEFLNLDLRTGETYVVEVEVLGTERVQVPSGMYTAYKVRVNPQDGIRDQFVWITKDSRKPVKITSRLPLGEFFSVEMVP